MSRNPAEKVDVAAELDVYELKDHLMTCEIPEGYSSKKYARKCQKLGLYKVYVDGLNFAPYDIANGYYLVQEDFAEKLLRNSQRQPVGTGLMFSGKRVTLQEFYAKNEHIEVSYKPN